MNNDIIATLIEARDDCAAGQSPRASHDRLAQALTAVIKLFEGDSAEADVLKRFLNVYQIAPEIEDARTTKAINAGILALRALPKVMTEVERKDRVLLNVSAFLRNWMPCERGPMMAQFNKMLDEVDAELAEYRNRAALNEGAKNG